MSARRATPITAHARPRRRGHVMARCKSYLTGFGLSVVLTAIPFWLVMSGVLDSKQVTALLIMAFAVVQIVVHMVYFLHMNAKSEGGWTHDGADLHRSSLVVDRADRLAVGDVPPQHQHDARSMQT